MIFRHVAMATDHSCNSDGQNLSQFSVNSGYLLNEAIS